MKAKSLVTLLPVIALVAIGLSGSGGAEVRLEKSTTDFRSPGKMQAPIQLQRSFDRQPAVGETLRLDLVFASPDREEIVVEIGDQDALALRARNRQVRSGATIRLDLRPQRQGRHYVTIVARMVSTKHARVFQIPVQVGSDKSLSTSQKATVGPDGEHLIRMPAR